MEMRMPPIAASARFLVPLWVLCLLAPQVGRAPHPGGGSLMADALKTCLVTVEADGESRAVRVPPGSVAAALEAAGIALGPQD
ncbi:MAG: ubiquitin-like domain-containing protein, partial [Armatimonadota bacterium]|nr:ubiquitin-like domain-containing protein [Armatimonadota bacterium]